MARLPRCPWTVPPTNPSTVTAAERTTCPWCRVEQRRGQHGEGREQAARDHLPDGCAGHRALCGFPRGVRQVRLRISASGPRLAGLSLRRLASAGSEPRGGLALRSSLGHGRVTCGFPRVTPFGRAKTLVILLAAFLAVAGRHRHFTAARLRVGPRFAHGGRLRAAPLRQFAQLRSARGGPTKL